MMTHPYDDIQAYALGGLEESQARAVLEHAESCPTCAVLMADAMATLHRMMGEKPERPIAAPWKPQPSLKPQVFASPRVVTRIDRARSLPWAVAAVALAACAALFVGNTRLRSNNLSVPVAALVHSHFTHHPLHGSRGSAKVIQALDGRWLYLVADGLPSRTRYTLSETVGGHKRVVGTFLSTDSGNASAYWEQPAAKIEGLSLDTQSDVTALTAKNELHWP